MGELIVPLRRFGLTLGNSPVHERRTELLDDGHDIDSGHVHVSLISEYIIAQGHQPLKG